MQHIENVEDRVNLLLNQIIKSTEHRDSILADVSSMVGDRQSLHPIMQDINSVRYQQLPAYVEKAASLARTLEGSASLAERSSLTVRRLDMLLSRVESVQSMTEAMISMNANVAGAPKALADGDLDRAVELINDYEKARRLLSGGGGTSSDSAAPSTQVSPLITEARSEARAQLLRALDTASESNDKLTMMNSTRLLAKLDFVEEGRERYCQWLCDHTIAALKKMVDRELRKMEDPTSAAMSHLALVSQALDTVAAAFEAEEEFTKETFGNEGPRLLLTELHQRSTAQCVPVLRDFMDKRQHVLANIQRFSSKNMDEDEEEEEQHAAEPSRGGDAQGSAASLSLVADARRADDILEETSHLVSCCHIYLNFAETKIKEYTAQAAGAAGTAAQKSDPDSLWASHNNALLDAVQDVLAMYVPLQSGYFQVAFKQALQLQMQAVYEATRQAEQELARQKKQNPSGNSAGSPVAIMAGLSTMYSAALGGDSDAEPEEGASVYYARNGAVTLPDDVFFFLRHAVHRAMSTQSTQVASAVIMSSIDVLQSRLVPEITKRAAIERDSGPPPSPGALRWMNAGQQAMEYSRRLAQELRKSAEKSYTGRDVVRFKELSLDIDTVTKDLDTALHKWLEKASELCFAAIQGKHMSRFAAISYVMTDEVYYHYELNDPWVQTFLADCSALLDYVNQHVGTACYDLVLTGIAKRLAAAVRDVLAKKQVNTFGALQVDKDVRALRTCMLSRAKECSLREIFAPLSLWSALLLSDTPRDALEEVANTALTAEEKRAVLLTRVEFKRQEVLALPL